MPKYENKTDNESLVYGRNAVIELLNTDRNIDKIFVQNNGKEGSLKLIAARAIKKGIPVINAEKSKLDLLCETSSHQGVAAYVSEVEYRSVDDILDVAKKRGEKPFIVIADKITDPHNLGAIIRAAECFGAHGVIIPKRNASGISAVVSKASAGATAYMATAKVANIAGTVESLKKRGVWVFSTYASGNNNEKVMRFDKADYDVPCALILGNEGDGISPLVISISDFLIKIPLYGKITSLNVSQAAAIIMYEIKRQRGKDS